MTIFCSKKLATPEKRLGAILKEAREIFGIDLNTASKAIHVPAKYLGAMEKNRFNDLPKAKVYRLNYLKEYARFLHLDENLTLEQFSRENGLKGLEQIHPKRSLKNAPLFSISIFARNVLIASFILFFVGYLAWQVKGVLEPPKLVVYSPTEGITTMEHNITVNGDTEKECRLAINGQEFMPDEKGHFELPVDLSDGLNTIIITATKKHGKVSTVTRHIVVKNFGQNYQKIISLK